MLTISGLTYRIGGRALLNEASAQIPAGGKVGLVGRNGAGKSTLLDLIRGALQPDAGDIQMPRGHRLGFLAQEAPSGERNPLDTVLAADTERAALLAELDHGAAPLRIAEIEARLDEIGARAAPARAARILVGLGLDAAMQERSLSELSGGWRMRVALAAVLFAEPDLLLLDEPTNHLDLEAALWLERFLRRYRHSFILVSHDRQLLNAATTTTLHLDNGKLALYSGGFDAFLRARREAAARQAALSRLDLRLDPDDRIALLGANGNGKTTFARLLAGRIEAFSGQMIRAPKLACGFFAQHQIEEMRPAESAFEHLAALMPESPPETVRARLGGFGFSQDKAFVPVGELSGGERARLNLALVTYNAPGLLILDEPTNHLDMETREALVAALGEYSGAVVLVSHDWHLVELVADRLWLVDGGTVRSFEDDLEAYRRRLLERDEPAESRASGSVAVNSRRAGRREAAERRRALEPLRQKARSAEEMAARLAAEQQALDRTLADPGAFGEGAALADALKRRAQLERRIAEAEAEWFEAATELERLSEA